MESKISILLTGAYGFLGSEILKHLVEDSRFEIKTLGKNLKSHYVIDLVSKPIKLNSNFDLVIHCAGKAHLKPKTSEEQNLIFDLNVRGTKNLLKSLTKNKLPKSFVFISSVSVYGLYEGMHINEEAPLLATDPYGKSKIEAEEFVIKWCKEFDVNCTILRLPLVVGVNPPGNLKSMILGIKRGYYFNISGGNIKKSMVLASDVSKHIYKISQIGGIYNLTDGVHPTFNELSNNISRQLGKKFVPNLPLHFAKILSKFGDIFGDSFPINSNKLSKINSNLTFDDAKARIAFGWEPTPVLKGFKLYEND
jgi:nucleoside-diphosphate-sugar epimerase